VSDDSSASREILRGASDGLLLAIREVDAKERQKRGVLPGDTAFAPLAREVTLAAETVLRLAQEEEERAHLTSGSPAGHGLPTIDDSAPRANLAAILDEWRRVERALAGATPGSAEAAQLMDAFETERDRYARALDAIKQQA
jgi:hypothetical protein